MKAWHYREHRGRGFSMLGDISARAHTHTHILSLKRVRNLLQCCAVLCIDAEWKRWLCLRSRREGWVL